MDPTFDTRIWEPAPKFGTQGKMFCGGMVFQKGGMGEPKGEMKPMGVTNLLAKPNPPRPTLEKWVYRDSHFPQFSPPGPLARALCGPWWPYTTPDQPPEVAGTGSLSVSLRRSRAGEGNPLQAK